MARRHRQCSKLLIVALVALAACSSSDDTTDVSTETAVLPTDVAVADDLIVATDDGLIPTPSTVPESIPAIDLPPDDPAAPADPAPTPESETDTGSEPTEAEAADTTAPSSGDGSGDGGEDVQPPAAPVPGEPLVITIPPSVEIEPPAANETPRIVSFSPSHTEMLFAMGAGELVVAVSPENNYVTAAAGREELSLELQTSLLGDLTAAFDPTLVIVSSDEPGTISTLGASGLPLYAAAPAASLDEIYRQVLDLGELTGRSGDAEALVEQMRSDMASILSGLGPLADGGLTFFHEVDPSLVTFDDSYFMVGLLSELGLTNVFVGDGSARFPQMTTAEIAAADPDVITLGDVECCRVTADSLRTRSGWDQLSAVRNGAIVPLTDAQYSGWGPGVIDMLRLVAAAMTAA